MKYLNRRDIPALCREFADYTAEVSAVVCGVKSANSFVRRQHLFDIAAKPTDFDSNFLSYPLLLFQFPQNVSYRGSDASRELHQDGTESRTDNLRKIRCLRCTIYRLHVEAL